MYTLLQKGGKLHMAKKKKTGIKKFKIKKDYETFSIPPLHPPQ